MSKAKKIISMLLAIVMVLTVAPVSGIASAAASNYQYGNLSFSKTDFTVDTTATTKVVRVGNPGQFTYGTTVIKTTRSGIPETSGKLSAIAYAGETPEWPKVVFTIKGVQPDSTPVITSDKGLTFGGTTMTSSGDTYTYTAEVTGGTASAGDNVTYTITYVIKGVTYTANAYAHVEDFLRQNGVLLYRYRDPTLSWKAETRISALFLVQGANTYSGWHSEPSKDNNARGFVNFATEAPMSGDAHIGMGNEDAFSTDTNALGKADMTGGTIRKFRQKNANTGYGDDEHFGYGNDGNRPESTVYLDKRNGSGTQTIKDLNLRLTQSVHEKADFSYSQFERFGTYNYQFSGSKKDDVPTSKASEWYVDDTTLNVDAEWGDKVKLTSSSVDSGEFKTIPFAGEGVNYSSTSGDTGNYSMGMYIAGFKGDYAGISAFMNVTFKVYDTTDLWNIYNGINNGDGSTYTTTRLGYAADSAASANQSVTFNKGVLPQEENYTAESWYDFKGAYDNAGIVLATPDTNQTAINAAVRALITAYNGLTGFNPNVQFEIKHVLSGTNTELIPSQTTDANGNTTKPAGTLMSHNAATIEGYTVVGSGKGTTLLSGKNAKEVVTYEYNINNYSVRAITNNDAEKTATRTAQYGETFAVSTFDDDIGTKAGYTFGGWYYDSGVWTQPVPANITIPANNVTIYAKWNLAPVTLTVDVSAAGKDAIKAAELTPETLGGEVSFTRPAFEDIDGYIFVDYYTDNTFTTKVTWPLVVTENTTVYARLDDVNGKITFDSNGGTPVDTITYTKGNPISAPQDPTIQGYAFKGWYKDAACTIEVAADDGGIWKNGKTLTMDSMTGFVAYAGWEAQQVTITFDPKIPTSETSTFNTTKGSIQSITGFADQEFADGYQQPVPRRLGYEFAYWSYRDENYRYHEFKFDKYPTTNLELIANWKATDYSAYIDITAYQKLLGEEVEVTTAKKGDVVTFKMTSQTNFYTGSSAFVFMYDNRFFEPYAQGTDAFILNSENDYIAGINADHYGVTNNSAFAAKWPSSLDSANYNAMMVTIDPNVALSQTTAPMKDGTWMLEFKLVIKDTASGSGKVYMDNAWTRTPDNVLGTMFYGWTKNAAAVFNTYNNVVIPNLDDATATIVLDEAAPVMTTVTVKVNSAEYPDAKFPDGDKEKTFTGRAGQEIVDYVAPENAGYTLSGWVNETNSEKSWIEGYYLPEDELEGTYVAQWTPNEYAVNFYKNETDETPWKTVSAAYKSTVELTGTCRQSGYTFAGWYYIDGSGNKVDVDLETYLCPLGGANIYAKWDPAEVSYTINVVYLDVSKENAETTKSFTKKALSDSYVSIVETLPENQLSDHTYILISDIGKVTGYMFDTEDSRNYPLPTDVKVLPNGSTEIVVYYTVAKYTITFTTGENATFIDGTTERKVENVPHGSLISEIAPAADQVIANEGYEFSAWKGVSSTTKANGDKTYTATVNAKSYSVVFDANGGAFSNGDTQSTKTIKFGATISAPTAPTKDGYSFAGWSTDKNATEGTTSLGTLATTTPPTYYAIYSAIDYYVHYTVSGESLYSDGPYHINDTVTVRAAETKTGHDFDGWYNSGVKVTTLTIGTADVTLTGAFTPKNYDVIFYHNNGTDASTKVSVTFGTQITAPAALTRNGYEFKGWAATSTATPDDVIETFGLLESETPAPYYAVWEATEADYYVDIYMQDVNGQYPASPDSTVTLTGKVATTTDEYVPAEHEGFTFDSASSVLSGTVTTAEEGALRLTVKYTRNKYNLVTDVDGNRESTEYYYGATVTAPANPEKEGYTFDGWTPEVPSTMPVPADGSSYVLTANFTANKYAVRFYKSEDDNAPNTHDEVFGTKITPITVSKTGHTFLGWAYKGTTDIINFNDTANPVTVKTSGNDFVAIWQVNKYSITWSGAGVADIVTEEYYGTAKEDITRPEPNTRKGYEFTGWNESDIPDTVPANNDTFVMGTYKKHSYIITFTNTGDSVIDDIKASYNDAITAPADPVKEGHTFLGWYEQGSETAYVFPDKMPAFSDNGHVITLEAKWQVESYTIIFKMEADGDVYKTITKEYGEAVTEPVAPEKTGHTFVGWDAEVPATMPVTPAEGLVINAKWSINSYEISYDSNGGSDVKADKYAYGAATKAPAEPTREGYSFAGWYLGNDAYEFTTMPAENIKLTAHWDINSYRITFDSNGGSDVTEQSYEFGATVTAPAEPTREGYSFEGWEPELPATMPANNVSVKAKWSVKQYTITFNVDGGSDVPAQTYDFGAIVTAPAAPTKTGYSFGGWDPALPETMPANSLEVKAIWNVNKYTITFDANGGTDVDAITQNYGTTVNAPDAPTRVGYAFTGWYLGNSESAYVFTTMPAESISLKAKWNINEYEISFNSNGGTDVEAIKRNYGTTVTAPAAPTKEGYSFAGWYLGDNEYEFTTMPAENIELTAHWDINSYTLTFLDANGAEFKKESLEYNSAITAPEGTPDKQYFNFIGWSLDGETVSEDLGKMPANDLVIYPVYERVTVTLTTSESSVAVIDKTNAKPPVTGYVYGLNERLTEEALRSALAVVGDGKLEITKVGDYKYLGTGTKIEVIDNVTNETVEIYYVIIFGDINGDSIVNASDASIINREAAGGTSWSTESSETYDYCKLFAADADKNGSITSDDYTIVAKASMRVLTINQATGEYSA